MTPAVAYFVGVLCVGVGLFAGWHTWRGYLFSNPLLYSMIAAEIVLLVAMVGGFVALANTSRDVDGLLFVSYYLTVVAVPPAAVYWGISDRTRWGTGVVAVAMLTVAVLVVRLFDIWTGTNG